MADIPMDTYNVTLGRSENNWANGALVYNASGVRYKGQQVSGWNPSTTNVSWTVTRSTPATTAPSRSPAASTIAPR